MMAINYGLNRVRFISPVHVGKRIRLRSKLLSVDEVQRLDLTLNDEEGSLAGHVAL